MDTREIQKLIDFISKSDLNEVNIETSELKLQIKRNASEHVQYIQAPFAHKTAPQLSSTDYQEPSELAAPKTAPALISNNNYIEVKSPMIGTFYRSAGPNKPNFVEVGDDISEGKTICIIEAMKLFNEIESEYSGKIVKILVEDATPVEFDQVLFLVDPS
jgi:acetyl-CoA carboxylase biotin carboxyl carrier protein